MGSVIYLLRDSVKAFFRKVPGDRRLKFVLFCTLLIAIITHL